MQVVLIAQVATLTLAGMVHSAWSIVPHVDSGGRVSWTATIDAATVQTFVDAGPDERTAFKRQQALDHWLDERLAAVGWCRHWRYRTEDAAYIEALKDGALRVMGVCDNSSE
jgi:hypothetical protein